MSDKNIVNDWVDVEKVRRVAEGLMSPASEITKAEDAMFHQDFVGFTEVDEKKEIQTLAQDSVHPKSISKMPKPVVTPAVSTVPKIPSPFKLVQSPASAADLARLPMSV